MIRFSVKDKHRHNFFQLKRNFEHFIQISTRFKVKSDFKDLNSNTLLIHDRQFIICKVGFSNFLSRVYPFLNLTHRDLSKSSRNYWNSTAHQNFHLEALSARIPVRCFPDWRRFETRTLLQSNGRSMLEKNASISLILPTYYPQFDWLRPGKHEKRVFLDELLRHRYCAERQHHLSLLKAEAMRGHPGGTALLSLHHKNLQALLQDVYPELAFWGCKARAGFWADLQGNPLLQAAMKAFDLGTKADWYRLSVFQLSQVYGKGLAKRNIFRLLEFWFPEEEWNFDRFSDSVNKRSRQRCLGMKLKELVGGEEVLEDYGFRVMDRVVIFDFYVPSVGVVFEYQGEQHYYDVFKWASSEKQKRKDQAKRELCEEIGLKMIYVPYWWDGTTSHLMQLIKLY
eukprot:TRINITY_DN22871_c0_g1_i1.p1 TRINITY_DN22871_c0_g1~~TRINITY_DN22871_c0_g1_i1.p1  ORF type:complete len:397 (+),score=70.83 TRINITY_DN22871_c0_g1_i1:98-1288(+)